jgi:adenylate kinase family enzyme
VVFAECLPRRPLGQTATMEKVAIFGNAGAGKSTLAKQLAAITGLPLFPLDTIKFRAGRYRPEEKDGGEVSQGEYQKLHAELLKRDQWIIDGYDSVASAWQRFDAADTLIYIDLPLLTLTPKYRQLVASASSDKRVHHLRSPAEIRSFLDAVREEKLKTDAEETRKTTEPPRSPTGSVV